MSCHWLVKGTKDFCTRPTKKEYCGVHAYAIRNGSTPPKECLRCGNGTNSQTQLCGICGQAKAYTKLWNERKLTISIK